MKTPLPNLRDRQREETRAQILRAVGRQLETRSLDIRGRVEPIEVAAVKRATELPALGVA